MEPSPAAQRIEVPRTGQRQLIKWFNAVIDIPAALFDVAGDFWVELTSTRRGEIHPEHDEFVPLIPEAGDIHLELQRIDAGPARVHLDLAVEDIPAMTERATDLGATLIARPGHAVLQTPGGVPFCIVPHSNEAERAPAIDPVLPHAADQICLDVPHDQFDADVQFWSQLTGWAVNPTELAEYRSFAQPLGLPLRVLIQRLGPEDRGGGRAHLDLSCGEHVSVLTERHQRAGAQIVKTTTHWTSLVDPAGMPYCLTSRQPGAD